MTRRHEPFDLRKANQHMQRRRERMAEYRQRTGKRRNQRRQVDLLVGLIRTGAMQR
jgi:hypothetical protein